MKTFFILCSVFFLAMPSSLISNPTQPLRQTLNPTYFMAPFLIPITDWLSFSVLHFASQLFVYVLLPAGCWQLIPLQAHTSVRHTYTYTHNMYSLTGTRIGFKWINICWMESKVIYFFKQKIWFNSLQNLFSPCSWYTRRSSSWFRVW